MNDIRFALRQLRKSPGFTLLALLTLALGIGLNTAIFSLINDLFLRGLPFKEPGHVLHMYSNAKDRNLLEIAVSAPKYQHYRDGQTTFDGFGADVGDVRSRRVAEADDMEFYRPWAQENFPFAVVAVRSGLRVDAVTKLVQSALNGVDPGLAIAIPQSMETIVAQALGQARLMMWLLGIFAGAALLLATVGIYGAVAYTVEQRTGEIGVRMALGAQTMDVLRLIVNQGMRPVFFGLVVGLAAALALGRLIASQLYQTSAHNPVLLAATMSILGLAAFFACVFPARRAALIDPVQALRSE